jgi:hypothetical protein
LTNTAFSLAIRFKRRRIDVTLDQLQELSTIFLKYDYVLSLAKNTGMWHPSRLGGWNNAEEKPISGSSLTGATHQA